ncbi:MAG: fibronectin type III domain-containing protein [Acidimicrobiales bacterium]
MTTPAGAVADDANATARSAAPKQGAPKSGNILQKKYGPLPGWGWAVLAAGGALAFFWWRSRESKAAAATTAATAYTAISGSGWSGAANALQDEIDGLQGSGGATSVPTSTAKTTSPVTPGTGVTTSKTTSPVTGSTTTPGPVTALTVTAKSPTVVVVSWRPPQYASKAPTSTTYAIQIKPKDASSHNIGSRTSYDVGGLKADTKYTAVVTPSGGPSASKSFTTPKKKT